MAQAEQPKGLFADKNRSKRFTFEGRSPSTGQIVYDEVATKDEEEARKELQRKGIRPLRVSKVGSTRKKRITQESITVFTRQLATMMRVGLPLMQAFEIVARSHSNSSTTQMLMQVHADMEQDSVLGKSFSKCPKYFDHFCCNLVSAGETGGVLEGLLDKLAVYKERTQAIKKKVKTALTYLTAVMVMTVALIFVVMMFVLPAFGEAYSSMDTESPGLMWTVVSMSKFFVKYGWVMIVVVILAGSSLYRLHQKSPAFQRRVDSVALRLPIFGPIVRKATIARWSRTTAALFAAGMPLIEVLDSVAGAVGNILYEEVTRDIQAKVTQGLSLTSSIQGTEMFPNMIIQMMAIDGESGSLDGMLDKATEFYKEGVDNSVSRLSSLMEPVIIVVLGSTIGILLMAMYLPLFNLGNVVG